MKNNSLLISNCIDLLSNMFDDKKNVFSFSTQILNSNYVNDYSNPLFMRYTINSYLGLIKFNSVNNENVFIQEFDLFIKNYIDKIKNIGDKGLLLYALSMSQHEEASPFSKSFFNLNRNDFSQYNLQEISWLLLGLIKYYQFTKDETLIPLSKKIFKYITMFFLNKDTLIPKHSLKNNIRKRFTAFGGIVYYLKVLFEYAEIFNDNYALVLYKELTKIIISMQNNDGSWAWFYDNKKSKVVDWYQIYSVHQDAMALLFLFPALKYFPEKADKSIIKSVNWLFGNNVLKSQMILKAPFFINRSIKRKHLFNEKAERIIRSYKNVLLNKQDIQPDINNLVVNPECRSYHIGWILYAWSEQNKYLDFHNLRSIKNI